MSGDARRMKVSPLTKVSVITLVERNVQYCNNLDCTYSELKHGDLTLSVLRCLKGVQQYRL